MISSIEDYLSGSSPRYGIMEPILHHRIKLFRSKSQTVVVHTAFSVNIGYLLPDAAFTGSNGAYTLKKFSKIIMAEHRFSLLKAIIIKNESFADEVIKNASSPLPELCCTQTIDTVAYAYDCI